MLLNKHCSFSELYPFIKEQLSGGGTACFTVKGVSMSPTLKNGIDTVCIKKPSFPLRKYDIPFYRRKGGGFVLHRVIKVKRSGYVCRGDRQTVKEYPVTEDMIVGVLCFHTHKGKTVYPGVLSRTKAFFIVHTAHLRCFLSRFYSHLNKRLLG